MSVFTKRVMVWSLALLAVPTVLCAAAPGFGALLALRAAQGLLIPGVTAVSIAWAGDHFAPRDTPAVVGGIIGASVVGGLVGRVATGFVADAAGWPQSVAKVRHQSTGRQLVARGSVL